jgi:hypothetical protein
MTHHSTSNRAAVVGAAHPHAIRTGAFEMLLRSALSTAALVVAIAATPLVASAAVTENFDGVTPPALPSGWTASVATGASSDIPFHTRASAYASTPPNAVWVDDVNDYADIRLTSPPYTAGSAGTFSFKQSYTLWAPDAGPLANGVYNGAVLEVSIGGGAFADVASAGGTIAYSAALDPSFDNPLAPSAPLNRSVWGGSSGGFVTASGTLPAAAANASVQFRWRLGTSGGGRSFDTYSGWWIDDFQCDCTATTVDEIFKNGFDP